MFDINVMTRWQIVEMARWLFVNMDNKYWVDAYSKAEWYQLTADGDDYKKALDYTGI